MIVQTLKGFRDFLPKEARKRQYIINTLKKVFELYGFEPLETPTLEYEEILLGKYGDEGDKLMYRFVDNGGRRVAMRYDQTVPLARVVAEYGNQLPSPFKRYQIQNVWRAENTQKGRFREFLQCDADIVGTPSPKADAEIVVAAAKALEALGFTNYKILINDRNNFSYFQKKFELTPEQVSAVIRAIDKLKKIGRAGVIDELSKIIPTKLVELIVDSFDAIKATDEMLTIMSTIASSGINEQKIQFYPPLARGLDYYTGMIFEIEIEGYSAGSVCGGGRYDKLIGMFGGSDIPAVGFAFGFDRVLEAMEELNLFPNELNETKILVTVFSKELTNESLKVANELRSKGINTELWLDEDAKLDKQLKYAAGKQIPFVAVIGPEEKEKNVVTLKNMKTRTQKQITQELLPDDLT